MAKRRTKQAKGRAKKREAKERGQAAPGGQSPYALKHRYLAARGLWGFECRDKPWRKSQ